MPEIVDKTGVEPDSASPEAKATSPENGAENGRRNVGAERRIAELVQQKHEINNAWQRKYDDLASRFDALEAKISQVGQTGDKRPQHTSPIFTSYEQLPQEDLDKLIASGPGESPAVYAAAMREDRDRAMKKLALEMQQSSQTQYKANLQKERAWNEIKARYGQDLDNPQSDLRQRAEQHMAQMRKEYGSDIVQDMNAQRLCVALAHHDLHARDQEELQTSRRELERMKQSQALESGIKGAAKLNDKVEEKLKKRDLKGAIRNLEMIQDLRQ